MAFTKISISALRCFCCDTSNFLNFINQNRMKSALKEGFLSFSSAILAVSSSFCASSASKRSLVVRVNKPSSIAFIRLSSFRSTSRSCFSSRGIAVFSWFWKSMTSWTIRSITASSWISFIVSWTTRFSNHSFCTVFLLQPFFFLAVAHL